MKAKRIVSLTFALVMISVIAYAIFATHVIAQDDGAGAEVTAIIAQDDGVGVEDTVLFDWKRITRDMILMAIYSIVGLIILMIGYKVFDIATPYDLNRQIAEENNVAAGVAVAGVLVSLGLIVAAAMG